MVVRDPTDEEVRGFLEFAGLSDNDSPLAVRALKQGDYDVNQLVMEFYDDPEAFRKKYSWDESAFASGRDGTAPADGASSFHIESIPEESNSQVLHGVNPGQDTTYYGQTAPSRPPTRTMNRSPLGRAIDLTSATIPGPTAAADEDEDLKRALMESANEAGLDAPPPQTSGVVSGHEQSAAFGPATREQYDTNQWALVRQDATLEESTSNVQPSARKRDPETPVLLLNDSTSMDQRLGSLLTILHEIPLGRNTLLQLGAQDSSYGHHGEWWTGKPIVPAHTTDWNSLDQVVVIEEEVHRLLGFLESTDRGFGSTKVLSELLSNSWDQEEAFFTLLLDRHGSGDLGPFMHEARSFRVGPPDTEHLYEDTEMAEMCYFKFTLSEDTHRNMTSLYDILDYEIWKQTLEDYLYTSLEQQNMSLFSDMGDILVMTVVDPFRSTKFELPHTWYPERYLWSRKKEAIGIQWLRRRIRTGMKEIEDKLSPPGKESLSDRLKRTEAEVNRCDLLLRYLDARPRFRTLEQSGFNGRMFPNGASDAPWDPTDEERESLGGIIAAQKEAKFQCERLTTKIQELETQMERYKASERFVGRLLTDPDRERPQELTCKGFSLRGIGTSKDTVYVCKRTETPLIDLGDDSPEPGDQWWRLEHTTNREQPVKAEKLDFEAVQLRVWEESNTVTLVFATEDAVSTPRIPLSDALTRFVKADNRGFQRELEREEAGADEPQHEVRAFQMRSRAGSVDSMASNRASIGSADSRAEEYVHEIHPDQLPDSDAAMDVDDTAQGHQLAEGGSAAQEGSGTREEDAEMQEMKEVSAQPIFMAGKDRPPPLPERK